jgi:hypothetical protein
MEIVSPLLPADAERLFLDRFKELTAAQCANGSSSAWSTS